MADRLADLSRRGVSIWLDDLSRERLTSGSLASLVARDHVVGVTTNPTIFAKAISGGGEAYAGTAARPAGAGQPASHEALRAMTTHDVRWACDVLRPVLRRHATAWTGGPRSRWTRGCAYDTEATIAEARALWWRVDRPNLFIKIPAARQGLPAITACLAEGISINVTLIFSLARYDEVIDAFLEGLERARRGRPRPGLDRVGGLVLRLPGGHRGRRARWTRSAPPRRRALRGRAAIANARLAYQRYEADARLAAVGRAGGGRGPAAAAAVGLDLGQGPGLPRHQVRDQPGRAGRGQHHARGHPARRRRPRPDPRGLGARPLPGRPAGAERAWPRSASTTTTSRRAWSSAAWNCSTPAGGSWATSWPPRLGHS